MGHRRIFPKSDGKRKIRTLPTPHADERLCNALISRFKWGSGRRKIGFKSKVGPPTSKTAVRSNAPRSRSTRFIFLLEEIGVPYEIKAVNIRRSDGSGAVDPDNPHPLGKVPALIRDDVTVLNRRRSLYTSQIRFQPPGSDLISGRGQRARRIPISLVVLRQCPRTRLRIEISQYACTAWHCRVGANRRGARLHRGLARKGVLFAR
jgi:hypothetical protein